MYFSGGRYTDRYASSCFYWRELKNLILLFCTICLAHLVLVLLTFWSPITEFLFSSVSSGLYHFSAWNYMAHSFFFFLILLVFNLNRLNKNKMSLNFFRKSKAKVLHCCWRSLPNLCFIFLRVEEHVCLSFKV